MAEAIFEKQAATLDDVLGEVSRIKSTVTEAVDDSVRTAMKAINQGRRAAVDALDDAEHAIKKTPFKAMGIIFAAGIAVGGMVAWMRMRNS